MKDTLTLTVEAPTPIYRLVYHTGALHSSPLGQVGQYTLQVGINPITYALGEIHYDWHDTETIICD